MKRRIESSRLIDDPKLSAEAIGAREGRSERSIEMALPLAFLAPDLVHAAIEGRLPRGFGVKRLTDLPMLWSEQWRALGLKAPLTNRAASICRLHKSCGLRARSR